MNIVPTLAEYITDHNCDEVAKLISDAINESTASKSQSFTIHKKVADKMIAISKINILKDK